MRRLEIHYWSCDERQVKASIDGALPRWYVVTELRSGPLAGFLCVFKEQPGEWLSTGHKASD